MKSLMLASAAMLSFTGVALAQTMPTTAAQPPAGETAPPAGEMAPPPAGDMAPPTDPAAPPPPADSAATTADPNAAQPTGAVPADPGMAPAPAGVPQDPTAPVGSSANPVTVGGNMTPPPAEAKDYPVCSRTVQDSCINPGEARKMRKR